MISLKNVYKYYIAKRSVVVGLRDVSLDLSIGEFVVITGESGSGKSTLLNVISGLDGYEEGSMLIGGEETAHYTPDAWETYRADNIGFIFQNYNIIDSYTVYQNIILALELQGYDEKERHQRTLELIEMVGLSHRIHQRAAKLSGGEKQRAVIARAIAKDCPVIVADEPTGNLDSVSGEETLKLLHAISKHRLIVLVTHHFADAAPYATRHIRMKDGEIVEDVPLKDAGEKDGLIKKDRHPIPLKTLVGAGARNVFATPGRFLFQLILQMLVIGVFIFIYAFIMYSEDILVGEGVADNDSSHQIRLVRRDEEALDPVLFENDPIIRSVGIYEPSFEAYRAFGRVGKSVSSENYPLGEIRMDDAVVLNEEDLTSGTLPGEHEVVMSDLAMELHDLSIGDQLLMFGTFYEYISTYGETFTISGSTIRGNNMSVYFNSSLFESKAIALDGLLNLARKQHFYYHYNDRDQLVRSSFSGIEYLFDPTLEEGQVIIPSRVLPDPGEIQIVDYEFNFGPYFDNRIKFPVSIDDVIVTDTPNEVIIMSTSFQNEMIDLFFGEDYEPMSLVLNVHDLTDGKILTRMIDQDEYRVFYHVFTATTRERILTASEFESLAYSIVFLVGLALYTVVGVVVRNISLARKKDFAIYRSIGASRAYLSRQVVFEQVLIGVIAFGFTVVALWILSHYLYTLSLAMRYLFFYQYVILFVISVFLSVFVARMYNRKVFGFSVIKALDRDGEARL